MIKKRRGAGLYRRQLNPSGVSLHKFLLKQRISDRLIQPNALIFLGQDDRHPVMDLRHSLICRNRNNRTPQNRIAGSISLCLKQPCHPENIIILEPDLILGFLLAFCMPLIKASRRDKAAALNGQILESAFLIHGFDWSGRPVTEDSLNKYTQIKALRNIVSPTD